jgi:hypothetical protein
LKKKLLYGGYKNAKKVKNEITITNTINNSKRTGQIDEMPYKYEIPSRFFHNSEAITTIRKKKSRSATLSNSYFEEKKAASSKKITSNRLSKAEKSSSNSSSFKMIIASSTPSFFLTNFNSISQTNVIEFRNTNNNNLIPSLDESDNNFLTSSSTQINSKDANYKPEVGIRIALMLGSLMCLIILYLLWRNRCHCLLHRFGLSVSVLKLICLKNLLKILTQKS